MNEYTSDFEWDSGDDATNSVEENDFDFDFEQQAHMGLGTDEDEISIDGLMGGGVGPWKVTVSAQAMQDLKQSRSEGNHFRILGKLQSLASGDWARRSVARPFPSCGHNFRVRLRQAQYGRNGRILWQVDVGYDEKYGSESQIVRVWCIGDVKEIQASLGAVERAQKTFSTTRVTRSKENIHDKPARLQFPIVFQSSSEEGKKANGESDTGHNSANLPDQELVAHDLLISGKFHTLTVNVFSSILHGQDRSDFPFDVTGTEATIIKHRDATFTLGRSGTGKTLCLLYKLMCRYLARNIVIPDEPIRQLLLTRSKPLAQKLQSEVKLLIDTQLLRVDNYPHDHDEVISYEDENDIPCQTGGVDMDPDTTEDLLSLSTDHFPFACTFDHFLRRLENTITAHDRTCTSISSRRLIDFTIFREAYWPRFPSRSKGHLQPDMVFTEIMGVLKGGATPLSRQEYIDTSARVAPTFTTEEDRQAVYTLFESYEKRKRAENDQDGIDRVRSVMNALQCDKLKALRETLIGMFEEVYVDEVQDQRPLEISLLLTLVQNPRGIHFAGDSAQCISQDSTFRFANLKTLFYNHFSNHFSTARNSSMAKATLFTLSHNFRSHQGILSLASWVMDKLWRGYPDCVDKLSPEIGTHMGPKPVFIIGPSLISFLQGAAGGMTGDQIRTQQIIIVRDSAVQTELEESEPPLPEGCIVFTVLQSKGMEYDDVYLYELFSRSPSLGGFRCMLEGDSWEGYASMHGSMCNELKNLYVAITRPRSRLFFLESDPDCIPELLTEHVPAPLVDVKRFKKEDVLNLSKEICLGNTSPAPKTPKQTETTDSEHGKIFDTVRPTNMTTAKQWIETGDQCMERGIFAQALRCYKNARDAGKIKLASASMLEERGKGCSARGDIVGIQVYFKEASEGFLELGMKERAASCLEARGDFVKAAELYREAGRYEKAARLFKRAGQHASAADEYFKCGKPLLALLALHEGRLYERLIPDFHTHRKEVPGAETLNYARECNKYVRRKGQLKPKLKSSALAMFASDDEKESFLKEFKHNKELVEFYVCRGRIKEALLQAATPHDFDDALEGMIENGLDNSKVVVERRVEKGDMPLEDVFNYAQTRRLLANISAESKGFSLDYNERHAGIQWGRKWEGFIEEAGGYIMSGAELNREGIKEEWIRAYLDIIVSVHTKYFLRLAKDLIVIPHAYLSGLGQRINEIPTLITDNEISKSTRDDEIPRSTRDSNIPQAILLALGVLYIPGEAKPYRVLRWSSLHSAQAGSSECGREVIVKRIMDHLTKRLQEASPLVEERVKTLWEGLWGIETKCAVCMTRVAWSKSQVGLLNTKCSHNLITAVDSVKSIQDLLGLQSSFAMIDEEYKLLRGVKPLEYPSNLKDYWLDALLNRLVYHSACFQSTESIISLRDRLCTPEAFTLTSALQRRFRERWDSWGVLEEQQDFTQLLEGYQLGMDLGLRGKYLDTLLNTRRNMIKRHHNQQGYASSSMLRQNKQKEGSRRLDLFEALREYRILQECKGASQGSMGRLLYWIDSLLLTLHRMLKSTKYLSFPHASVISVFEGVLTLLLFAFHRPNILVPVSWTHLYLPLWAPIPRDCTHSEMDCYRQALVRTMSLFYQWVVDSYRSGPQDVSLQRRCLDLCFVALINIGTAAGCRDLWAKAYKVLTNITLDKKQALRIQPQLLIKQLSEAFERYNGADTLILYVREVPLDEQTDHLASFATVELLPLGPQLPPLPRDSLSSAYLITSWYRRRRDIRADYRKYKKTDMWKAVNRLQPLCKYGLPMAAVVMTDGMDLYQLLQKLTQKINAAHEKERKRAEKEELERKEDERKRAEKEELERKEKARKGAKKEEPEQNASDNEKGEIIAPGIPKQDCAKESVVVSQKAEKAKTEWEILNELLQERNAFFDVCTTADLETERWRQRCKEEMAAVREMEKILKDWIDKMDGKTKTAVVNNPKAPTTTEKRKPPVPQAGKGKAKGAKQVAPPALPLGGLRKGPAGKEEGETVPVSSVASKKDKRKAKKGKK